MSDELERFARRGHAAQAAVDALGAGAGRPWPKSDLAYLVTGIVLVALNGNPGIEALELHAVPELVDGVTPGRVFLEDADGRRRLVVDVLDA